VTTDQIIRHLAASRGYNRSIQDALVGIAHHESGLNPRSMGDNGTSYGLFQLHTGGALGNMSAAQARRYLDPHLNTNFALDHLQGILHNGMSTSQAVDAISRRFERPANPSGEIADALAWLRSGGGSGPSVSSTGLQPAAPVDSMAGMGAAVPQVDPALAAAVRGAQANQRLLHLPYIKLPTGVGPIPMNVSFDHGATPATSPAPSQLGGAIAHAAKQFLGIQYLWGGTSPKTGFDCSGLTQYVFNKYGVHIPRVAQAQFNAAHKVPQSQARAGDLIFFSEHGGVGHVGIYLGNGQFLHAPHTGDHVKISNLAGYGLPIAGFGRFAR
jgi:cell wall-associated NlpC family hydrolase